jgi:hypothetical protein
MRQEGGWIPIYRAHREADTMVAGHIAKAMRDIDDEAGKNDWVRAIISRGEAGAEALPNHSGRSFTHQSSVPPGDHCLTAPRSAD